MVTFGFFASKSLTVFSQNALPGPVVELCQKVIETFPPSRRRASLPDEQPAATSAVAPISAMAAAARIFILVIVDLLKCRR